MEQPQRRNPGLAAVFSFIFSGMGQLYNGQIRKGLLLIFVSSINILVLIIASSLIGLWLLGRIITAKILILGIALFFCSLVSICILGIYSIIDAYRDAAKK